MSNTKSNPTHTKKSVVAAHLPKDWQMNHINNNATAFAPSNIALSKYWGKREQELNLPINGSLSISLGNLGTTTTIAIATDNKDSLSLNGDALDSNASFYKKVFEFVDLFRTQLPINGELFLKITTVNTIPTAAGLASSASGFGALALAVNEFFGLNLPKQVLSAFARMGSGSASRSLYTGFVKWQKGEQADGMDSYAYPVAEKNEPWYDFRIGLVKVSTATKKINSRDGMNRTVATSHLYKQWPAQAEHDLATIEQAVLAKDFETLGQTAEHNALSMHATMIATFPPVLYWQPESVTVMHQVWQLREQGTQVYLTMDAGPNVKLLFLAEDEAVIKQTFAEVEVIAPFTN